MPIFSAVGHFCYDKFEETPNEKVVNISKLTKPFSNFDCLFGGEIFYTLSRVMNFISEINQ